MNCVPPNARRQGTYTPSEASAAGGSMRGAALPNGWKMMRVKNIASITNGSDPKTDGGIPVYGSGEAHFKTCGEHKEGPTVLLGRKGATLHIPHFIEGRYWNVDTAFDVHMKGGNSLRWFFYRATCFDYKFYMSQTTLPSMTQTDYGNMRIALPPLAVQERIVRFLDAKTAAIDALAGIKRKQIDELHELRKTIINRAVTGGMAAARNAKAAKREGACPHAPSDARRLGTYPPSEASAAGGSTRGAALPNGWKLRRLKTIVSCNDEALSDNTPGDQRINYVEISDVNESNGIFATEAYLFKDAPSRARRITRKGDVIISTVRTYLKAIASIDTDDLIVSTGFAVLRAKGEVLPVFLSYAVKSEELKNAIIRCSCGVSYPAINASRLVDLTIPLPPLAEQREIAAYLDEKCAAIDKAIANRRAAIGELVALKARIVADAVTGRMEVE